jgi:hypothetical protein
LRQINNVKNAAGVNVINTGKDAWYQKTGPCLNPWPVFFSFSHGNSAHKVQRLATVQGWYDNYRKTTGR